MYTTVHCTICLINNMYKYLRKDMRYILYNACMYMYIAYLMNSSV